MGPWVGRAQTHKTLLTLLFKTALFGQSFFFQNLELAADGVRGGLGEGFPCLSEGPSDGRRHPCINFVL